MRLLLVNDMQAPLPHLVKSSQIGAQKIRNVLNPMQKQFYIFFNFPVEQNFYSTFLGPDWAGL